MWLLLSFDDGFSTLPRIISLWNPFWSCMVRFVIFLQAIRSGPGVHVCEGIICRMQCGAPSVPFGSLVLGSYDVDS